MKNKQEILGQYFTKIEIVRDLVNLVFLNKHYKNSIKILEPSFGTGNFIKALKEKKFSDIEGCEIDEYLTKNPSDFFNMPFEKKYDLIIGNPPFSKYNLKESYFNINEHLKLNALSSVYLTKKELKKDKEKIENIFLLKSLKHLQGNDSSIGFVLPISFFIKNRNKSIKNELLKYFSTIIIYQNDKAWFDKNIPCCFAFFTNSDKLKNKIVLLYENGKKNEEVFSTKDIHEELIPQVVYHKNNGYVKNDKGTPLTEFFKTQKINIKKSYKENNISAKNILEKKIIPENKMIENYKIAIVRVGNSSVGKCGLINAKEDVLNDMFYIFDVKDQYVKNKRVKESICRQINKNIDYFRNITCRVGSKSIKKEDIYNFKISI
ncbi:Eco57I restriction-modification methylase domain-containing protein [Patescibacteria group bacterium]|nr:Eco57I restriction-modification methylase domain-containing protein [Patescibacteria group bacterium]